MKSGLHRITTTALLQVLREATTLKVASPPDQYRRLRYRLSRRRHARAGRAQSFFEAR